MNNSTQAKKGFKTFLLTLSISLIIFSVVYYVLTNVSGERETLPPDVVVVETDKEKEDSVFEQLAAQKMDNPGRSVLAGADVQETTEPTTSVPVTGITEITFGLITAGLLFTIALFVISKDPRKLAILSFEKRTVKRL